MWMVRAGRGGENADDFIEKKVVGLGRRAMSGQLRHPLDRNLEHGRRGRPRHLEDGGLVAPPTGVLLRG